MEIAILGGHGKIALLLARQLREAGHAVRSTHRDPAQVQDIAATGATPILYDIEDPGSVHTETLEEVVAGADAVVFAAGSGPGSGPERKRTVDLGGAVALVEAARAAGVERFVMVSAMGADQPEVPGPMGPYLEAKHDADAHLAASGLAYTIVRPGHLTDDEPTGQVEVAGSLGRGGEIPRADVAAVLVAVLEEPGTAGQTFELLGGATPIAEAVGSLVVGG